MTFGNKPQVINTKLPFGVNANLETVEIMKRVARQRAIHPEVRQLALAIIRQAKTQSQNYIDEAIAIGKYVHKHMNYVRDIDGVEQLHDPVMLIDQLRRGVAIGDCDDMSLLIATLLLSIGHKPYFRIVRYGKHSGPYHHIYVVVYEKNWKQAKKRLVLDAILKRSPIGTEVPHTSGKEIKI